MSIQGQVISQAEPLPQSLAIQVSQVGPMGVLPWTSVYNPKSGLLGSLADWARRARGQPQPFL